MEYFFELQVIMSALMKLLSLIFDVSCFVVAVVQITALFQLYFGYHTTSQITQTLDSIFPTPGVVFCTRYLDVIDRQAIKTNLNINIKTQEPRVISEEMSKVTVKQILTYTPTVNESIVGCSFRALDDFKMTIPSVESCRSSFDIFKLYMQDFVCYQFQFKRNHSNAVFVFKRVSNSLEDKNVIYRLELNEKLSKSSRVLLIVINVSQIFPFPVESRNWSPVLDHRLNYNYELSYSLNKVKKLPPPYDTDCNVENRHNKCFVKCLKKRLKKIERVSFSEITDQLIDLKHVNHEDLAHSMTRSFIKDSEDKCNSICKTDDCDFDFTVTRVEQVPKSKESNLVITVNIPNFPKESVTYSSRLSLIEFLVYLLNCFGIYFGISVFSLNPFRIFSSIKMRRGQFCPVMKFRRRKFALFSNQKTRERKERLNHKTTSKNRRALNSKPTSNMWFISSTHKTAREEHPRMS